MTNKGFFLFLFLSCFSLFSGCSDSPEDPRAQRVAVSGTVLYKGKKVSEGAIQFTPADGNGYQAFGAIKDGNYTIEKEKGPSVGKQIVKITAHKKTGKKMETEEGMVDISVQFLPAQYNVKTKLTAKVEAEDNELNYELE